MTDDALALGIVGLILAAPVLATGAAAFLRTRRLREAAERDRRALRRALRAEADSLTPTREGVVARLELEHAARRCTGVWIDVEINGHRMIACTDCPARYMNTPERWAAAAHENRMGRLAQELTSGGGKAA